MAPYYNYPYSYNSRNVHGMPPPPPVPSIPMQPAPTPPPVPSIPFAPPVQQMPVMPPMPPAPNMNQCPMMQNMMPGMMQNMMPGMMQNMMPGMMPMGPQMMPPMGPQMMPSTQQMQQMPQTPMISPAYPITGIPTMPDMMGGMGGDEVPLSQATGDPPPVLSNNPAVLAITLFKELTGYPNYGNPSGNADILYTRTRGDWTFDLPPFLSVPGLMRGVLVIRACLDDHAGVPVSRYSAQIIVNGVTVHNGAVPLEHGRPAGGRFENWRNLNFNITNTSRTNRVRIINTSTTSPNDWIGFDWMEMRFLTR